MNPIINTRAAAGLPFSTLNRRRPAPPATWLPVAGAILGMALLIAFIVAFFALI